MNEKLKIAYVPVESLNPSEYNPRKWDKEAIEGLTESVKKYGLVDPVIANSAPGRENVIIGGHFRHRVAKDLGIKEIPVVYLNISDLEKEKELNIRLNRNLGEFDYDLLSSFSEELLIDIGFTSEELDDVFDLDDFPEEFDLEKELKKIDIDKITVRKGDVYELGQHRVMCGDSTIEEDVLKLMDGYKADLCLTDPPYILDYVNTKFKGKGSGFGYKQNRRYLETDEIPDDFTEKWMANINKVQKDDFHIIAYENWKNIRTIWNEMEKYWKVKNMLVWHLPNRTQGFSAKYRFFSKHDIAMVGEDGNPEVNLEEEEELLQNEYETALYAISGHPHWESYGKGKKLCPTDHIDFKASDEKSSGQSVIFGTKPVEILIPYIKVLTKRDDLVIEPFGGSGSTLIASHKLKRRCFLMEKSPVYTEVILKRFEKLTGISPKKIDA
jgi:DNA modification methylase